MSLISEQIKNLRKGAEFYRETYGNGDSMYKVLKQAADTIEELSAKLAAANMERSTAHYNGGWIPLEERLPSKPEENPEFDNKPLELYLASVRGTKYPLRVFWNGKIFTDGWGKLDVTAWMPLPEPYRPKGE